MSGDLQKKRGQENDFLRAGELNSVLGSTRVSPRNLALIHTVLATGATTDEIRRIKIRDVILDDERPRIKIRHYNKDNSVEEQISFLRPDSVDVLRTHIDSLSDKSPFLFPNRTRTQPITRAAMDLAYKKVQKDLKLPFLNHSTLVRTGSLLKAQGSLPPNTRTKIFNKS